MTAEIIAFPIVHSGNHTDSARDLVQYYFEIGHLECPNDMRMADHFLSMLWANGYTVAPAVNPGANGWGGGAGADFVLAKSWNLDLSYLYVDYKNPVLKNENLLTLGLNYHF